MTAYFAAVQANNPIHYWELPVGGAQIARDFGSIPEPLVLRAGSGVGPGYAGVWAGGLAWAFNGSTYLSSDNTYAPVSPVTLECWVWLYSPNAAVSLCMDWGNGTAGAILGLSATRHVRFSVDTTIDFTDPAVLSLHQWHHLVGTYAVPNAKLYVDNVNVANQAGGGALAGNTSFSIGAGRTGTLFFPGMIASPAIYAQALIAAQINSNYVSADQRTVFPEYVGAPPSGYLVSAGGGAPADLVTVTADLTQVLAAVKRTY